VLRRVYALDAFRVGFNVSSSCFFSHIQYDFARQEVRSVREHDRDENNADHDTAHDERRFELGTVSDPHRSAARHAGPDRQVNDDSHDCMLSRAI